MAPVRGTYTGKWKKWVGSNNGSKFLIRETPKVLRHTAESISGGRGKLSNTNEREA